MRAHEDIVGVLGAGTMGAGIDQLGAGFRMGPFELMDLIGIETNHAVAESFHRATYGEPRYRPSPLAARMIAAGRLGRKTGRGWYEYPDGASARTADPDPPAPGGGDGRTVAILGEGTLAAGLRDPRYRVAPLLRQRLATA